MLAKGQRLGAHGAKATETAPAAGQPFGARTKVQRLGAHGAKAIETAPEAG